MSVGGGGGIRGDEQEGLGNVGDEQEGWGRGLEGERAGGDLLVEWFKSPISPSLPHICRTSSSSSVPVSGICKSAAHKSMLS